MKITEITITRDDAAASGEFHCDDHLSRWTAVRDAAERRALGKAFPGTAITVDIARNTSGMRTTIQIVDADGEVWTDLDDGSEVDMALVHVVLAMDAACMAAYRTVPYCTTCDLDDDEEERETRARRAAIDTARDLPEGWEIDNDDGDSFTAYPCDVPENGHGIGVQLTPDPCAPYPVTAYAICARDGAPTSEDFVGSTAIEDACGAAAAWNADEEDQHDH